MAYSHGDNDEGLTMTIRASFHGSLGRNAETKTVGDNKVTKFSVANNSGYGDKKVVSWVDCNAWGSRYEKLAQYLIKGQSVLVYGELEINEYQAKDGTHKSSLRCRVTDIELIGKKGDGEGKSDESPSYNTAASSGGAAFPEDDIPFACLNDFQH